MHTAHTAGGVEKYLIATHTLFELKQEVSRCILHRVLYGVRASCRRFQLGQDYLNANHAVLTSIRIYKFMLRPM